MFFFCSISQQKVSSVSINSTGDWLAFGCRSLGQLLVWEWASETYLLKQQGHFYDMNCLAYSPDGQYVATGGDDSKVCFASLFCLLFSFWFTLCELNGQEKKEGGRLRTRRTVHVVQYPCGMHGRRREENMYIRRRYGKILQIGREGKAEHVRTVVIGAVYTNTITLTQTYAYTHILHLHFAFHSSKRWNFGHGGVDWKGAEEKRMGTGEETNHRSASTWAWVFPYFPVWSAQFCCWSPAVLSDHCMLLTCTACALLFLFF